MSGFQNRSCCNIIYRLGLNIVILLTLLLSMLLFAGSFLTTCYADNMETQQVLLRPDNPLWNLLELAGFGLLFCGCLYLCRRGPAGPQPAAGYAPRTKSKTAKGECAHRWNSVN